MTFDRVCDAELHSGADALRAPLTAPLGRESMRHMLRHQGKWALRPIITKLTAVLAFLLLAAPLAVEAQEARQPVQTVGVLTPQRLEQQPGYPTFLETL